MSNTLEKEVRSLILGEQFAGEFQGVSYEVKICWSEDWTVNVDLLKFKPRMGSHTHFWLGKITNVIIEEVLYDAIYELPEVVDFQKRIDAMRDVDEDVLDNIIEKVENEE